MHKMIHLAQDPTEKQLPGNFEKIDFFYLIKYKKS